MKKSKLSPPIYPSSSTITEMIITTAVHFNKIFMQKDSRPYYNGKFVFFDINKKFNDIILPQPERFMHISSIVDKEKYTIFPCNNDFAYELCPNQCNMENALKEYRSIHRIECIYRLSRIHWIPEVINLANNNDLNIMTWTEKCKDKNKNLMYKHYIRYECGMDDYVVILKEKRREKIIRSYEFITAFPVFFKRNKYRYRQAFQKSKKK